MSELFGGGAGFAALEHDQVVAVGVVKYKIAEAAGIVRRFAGRL